MGEHENWSVVRRRVAPPSLPGFVWPRPADGSEHVAANDPRSDIVEATRDKIVINTCSAAILAMDLLKGSGAEDPFMHGHAADPKWIGKILIGAGAVAIERDGKALHAKFGHKVRSGTPVPRSVPAA